ncbi:phosphatase PAP2 family protein [Mongoliimonas terrestris]|uniref:phosphatase PAP2 family protein n=1 Tax=Mongoliimonas terrestris TaxID=1709001 RepID=UPI0009FB1068|nr:phosphatase PAP2 family protein [Mongoliimonas terrestris]
MRDARATAGERLEAAGRDGALGLLFAGAGLRFMAAALLNLTGAAWVLALCAARIASLEVRARVLSPLSAAWRPDRAIAALRQSLAPLDAPTRLLLVILLAGTALTVAGFALNDEARAGVAALPDWLRKDMRAITRFGKSDWILIPLLVGILGAELALRRARLPRRWAAFLRHAERLAIYGFAVIAISGVAAIILKFGLGHPRPSMQPALEGLGALTGPTLDPRMASFPSGHATTMAALVAGLAFLWPRVALAVAPFALLVAASRSVVGAHFASDIAAGLLLGGASTVLIAGWFAERRLALRVGARGLPVRRRFPTRWIGREIGRRIGFPLASGGRTDDTGAR